MGSAFPAVLAAGFPCLSVLTLTHKQLFYRWHISWKKSPVS